MIKINLLPVKAAKRREQGTKIIIAGAAIVAAMTSSVVVFHTTQMASANKLKTHNQGIQGQIGKLKAEVGDYDLIKAQREDLVKQREAIKRLQANRAGPVWMMRELSDILVQGKGPTFNKEQYEEQLKRDPNAGFNPNWNPKRVWITNYAEKQHLVQIKGGAKSDEDVAEFLKRLKQSAFFSDVYWQQTQPQYDKGLNVSYVTFDVNCKVNY